MGVDPADGEHDATGCGRRFRFPPSPVGLLRLLLQKSLPEPRHVAGAGGGGTRTQKGPPAPPPSPGPFPQDPAWLSPCRKAEAPGTEGGSHIPPDSQPVLGNTRCPAAGARGRPRARPPAPHCSPSPLRRATRGLRTVHLTTGPFTGSERAAGPGGEAERVTREGDAGTAGSPAPRRRAVSSPGVFPMSSRSLTLTCSRSRTLTCRNPPPPPPQTQEVVLSRRTEKNGT